MRFGTTLTSWITVLYTGFCHYHQWALLGITMYEYHPQGSCYKVQLCGKHSMNKCYHDPSIQQCLGVQLVHPEVTFKLPLDQIQVGSTDPRGKEGYPSYSSILHGVLLQEHSMFLLLHAGADR